MFYKKGIRDRQSKNHIYSNKLKANPTKSEVIFARKLEDLGIKYMFQKGFVKGDFSCIVDFYLPKPHKMCIEIDGGYHTTEKQKYRDAFKDRYLKCSRKFKVLRLANEVAEDISLEELKKLIIDNM